MARWTSVERGVGETVTNITTQPQRPKPGSSKAKMANNSITFCGSQWPWLLLLLMLSFSLLLLCCFYLYCCCHLAVSYAESGGRANYATRPPIPTPLLGRQLETRNFESSSSLSLLLQLSGCLVDEETSTAATTWPTMHYETLPLIRALTSQTTPNTTTIKRNLVARRSAASLLAYYHFRHVRRSNGFE